MIDAINNSSNAAACGKACQEWVHNNKVQSNLVTKHPTQGKTSLLDNKIPLNIAKQSTNAEKSLAISQFLDAPNAAIVVIYAQLVQEQSSSEPDNYELRLLCPSRFETKNARTKPKKTHINGQSFDHLVTNHTYQGHSIETQNKNTLGDLT